MLLDVVGGDLLGPCEVNISWPWMGSRAKYFQSLKFGFGTNNPITYQAADIIRAKNLSSQMLSNQRGGTEALASGLAFGAVGAIASMASKGGWVIGLEFKDGKKSILKTDIPHGPHKESFIKFLEENGLFQFDF